MKTVHSQVLSSDPISLSDATSFLSAFNTSVCGGGGRASVGASPETCWFVRRALVSFEELEQLHHKLNDRKPRSKTHNDDAKTTVGDNPSQSVAASRDVTSNPRSSHPHDDVISRRVEVEEQSEGGEVAEIDDNKKKKKEKKKSIIGNIGENGGGIEEGDGESDMVRKEKEKKKKKKKKKKRDNVHENPGEIKEEEDGESEMKSEEVNREEKKKKKKRKSEVLESGEVDASEEQQQQEKRKKKRKSEVLESGKVDASEEQQEKRKKRKS